MNVWAYKWERNGWYNSAGGEVANADLIREAVELSERLSRLGRVAFVWIPRSQNVIADRMCNDAMDDVSQDSWY